jgi:predicted RNA-binding Zn ribbon-like protein
LPSTYEEFCAERGIEVPTVQRLHDALGFTPPAASDQVREDDLIVIELVEQFVAVRGLRDTLRELVAAVVAGQRPADAAIATLNRLSRQAPTAPQLGWPPAGQPAVTVQPASADPGAVVLAELARAGIGLLGGPDRQRLRACHAPGCVLFFVKQHPRREWCSQACGNRARAARHYARHRSSPAAPGSEPTAAYGSDPASSGPRPWRTINQQSASIGAHYRGVIR